MPKTKNGTTLITGHAPALGGDTYTDLPDDAPIYSLIGRSIAQWAKLEHILDLTIRDLSGLDATSAACITSQLFGANPRYDAIISLCKTMNLTKSLRKANSLKQDMRDVQDKRNRIVHDPWCMVIATHRVAQLRSVPPKRKDIIHGLESIDDTYMITFISEMKDKIQRATNLRATIQHELSSLREKRR